VLAAAMDYNWPGNVRELENTVERMVVINQTGQITEEDLPARIRSNQQKIGKLLLKLPDEGINFSDLEKELIGRALEKCDYNQVKTARYLGITRNTLLYRIEKFKIDKG